MAKKNVLARERYRMNRSGSLRDPAGRYDVETTKNRSLGVVGTAKIGGGTAKVRGRLDVVGFRREKRKFIVEREEMPGDDFFGVPHDFEGLSRGERARPKSSTRPGVRKRPRLTKSAYLDAAEARTNVPPDQLAAFDAVWRSLWPTGLATLSERFAEWVEEHPTELAEYQLKYIGKREKQIEREVRRHHRERAKKAS